MFSVYTNGRCSSTADKSQVVSVLGKALHLTPSKIEAMIDGNTKVIRHCKNKSEATRLLGLLAKLGVHAYINDDKKTTTIGTASSQNNPLKQPFGQNIASPQLEPTLRKAVIKGSALAVLPALCYFMATGIVASMLLSGLFNFFDYALALSLLPGTVFYIVSNAFLALILFHLAQPIYQYFKTEPNQLKANFVDQPHLLQFINGITKQVNAPPMTRIYFTDKVTSKVTYRSGWIPGAGPAELQLEIGLPLIYALTTDELCGLLTQKITPFSFGSLSRAIALANLAADTFAGITKQDQTFDKQVSAWLKSKTSHDKSIFMIYKGSGFFTHQFAKFLNHSVLALARNALKSFHLYNDKIAAQLAGNRVCQRALNKFMLLQWSYLNCQTATAKHWQTENLPRNFPLWVARSVERIPSHQQEHIQAHFHTVAQTNNCLAAPMKLRLQFLAASNTTPMIRIQHSVSKIVNRLEKLSIEISLQRYRRFFSLPVKTTDLIAVDEPLQAS